jgi:hypothetical protein
MGVDLPHGTTRLPPHCEQLWRGEGVKPAPADAPSDAFKRVGP